MYNPATGANLVASEPGPLLWCHMLFDISCVQLLPDPVLGPMAVAVPSLFAVHMAIIGRCKSVSSFEKARKSPLILSLTGFGLGVYRPAP